MALIQDNVATICGIISSEITYSHTTKEKSYYRFFVQVKRLSEQVDRIPIVAEKSLLADEYKSGDAVMVHGEFRSHNHFEAGKNKLDLFVFAKQIEQVNTQFTYKNAVRLIGFLCREVQVRETPMGRMIGDIMIARNRQHKKSDYIPCIAWGNQAKEAGKLRVGDRILIEGRIQSRTYQKTLGDVVVSKTAYEISVSDLQTQESHVMAL